MMNINLIVIRTHEPKVLADFYTILGMQFDYHQHGKGQWHYSVELEGTVFEIYPLQKHQTQADTSLRLGFCVQYLDALISSLGSQNITIVSKPKHSEHGYYAVVKDPDGRKIELKQS